MTDGGEDTTNHGRLLEPDTPRALVILGLVLERLVARNDQLARDSATLQLANGHTTESHCSSKPGGLAKNLKVFHGVREPNISIAKYLDRLYKYTNCSPSCFVVGYVYIDRLVHRHPQFLVVSLNVHRLLVTSVMVAAKMLDDEHYNNALYARVGGVSNEELNRLELELLFLLDFWIMISSPVFESYCSHLEKEMLQINAATTHVYTDKPLASTSLINSSNIVLNEISVEETQTS